MARMVGLSRTLKTQWLNKAVELVLEDLSESEIKEQLNHYLSFEIASPTNLRKTREILMSIWVYDNEYSEKLRKQALSLIKQYPDYALEINWCMMLAAYPVFVDMCKLIGKTAEFQEEITLDQIKQKLFDEWGERSTLFHSIDKLIATLKNLGVLTADKPGKYSVNKHKVSNEDIVTFMVYTVMCIEDNGYSSFADLNTSSFLFAFDYVVERKMIFHDNDFTVNNFGGELSISLRE